MFIIGIYISTPSFKKNVKGDNQIFSNRKPYGHTNGKAF